jgi:ArsR family transcriptional regulator
MSFIILMGDNRRFLIGMDGANIFAMTNVLAIEELSRLLLVIGQPARLQILLAIGGQETCVCHLEEKFGWRQAYLSQHLKALRQAGVVVDRREGRFIHYRLKHPALLEVIRQAAQVEGISLPNLSPSSECCCPHCEKQKEESHA